MRSFEEIEAALRASAGVISIAAQKLKVHRQRLYEWMLRDPKLQEIAKQIREEILDLAEGKLLEAINTGSEKSIHFLLRTIGRDRGYSEKVVLAGAPGETPIGIAIANLPDLSRTTQSDRDALRAILERAAGEPESGTSGA